MIQAARVERWMHRLARVPKVGWIGRQLQLRLSRVHQWSSFLTDNVTIVDVGCRWGFAEAWSALGARGTIVGFDPDAAECERLKRAYRGPCDARFVPAALGASAGRVPLFLTKEPACSSIFEPDSTLTERMPELACAQHVGNTEVEMTTLDDWAEREKVNHVDFLKVDTQGAELMVLQGAQRCLATTRMLEVEVEFNPIYRKQPLFGDVDAFLRGRGFVLWRLKNLAHYGISRERADFPVRDEHYFDSTPVNLPARGGQLLWGHAYFVKREIPLFEPSSDWKASLRDACISRILGFNDISDFALHQAIENAPAAVSARLRAT